MIILRMLALAPFLAQASEPPTYLVLIKEARDGKDAQSSSVLVQERMKGDIKSTLSDNSGIYFEVVVAAGKGDKLSLDYRFKDTSHRQTVEIAKTAVALKSGATETTNLKDSGGNDITLKVTITRLGQATEKGEREQKLRSRE